MKNIFFLIILFFIFFCGKNFGQDSLKNNSKKIYFGIGIAHHVTQASVDARVYDPTFSIFHGRSVFTLAPRISFYKNPNAKIFGFNFDYKFFPFRNDKRFKLYLFFNFDFMNAKAAYTSPAGACYPLTYTWPVYSRRDEEYRYGCLNAGPGIQVKLLRNFYLFSNIGIGTVLGFQRQTYTCLNTNQLESIFNDSGPWFSAIFSVGLYYQFKKK